MPTDIPAYIDIPAEQFVTVWASSFTTEMAAHRLGMPVEVAVSWAWHYRDVGVPLKELPSDSEHIARVIEQVIEMGRQTRQARRSRIPGLRRRVASRRRR